MATYLLVVLMFTWISTLCTAQYTGPIKATKEVAGIDLGDVIVECYRNGVKVIIEKSSFPRIQSSQNLRFQDPMCIAGENATHFIASTTYRRCGTSRKVQWNGLAYSNTLMTGFPETDNFDPRCPVVSIKFTCVQSLFVWPRPRMTRAVLKYINCEHIVALGPKVKQGIFSLLKAKSSGIRVKSRVKSCPMLVGIGPPLQSGEFARQTVMSKAFSVKRSQTFICRRLEGKGEHNIELTAYSNEDFSKRIGDTFQSSMPVIDVFYELKLTTLDSSLTIYPKRCYATPTNDPLHKVQYDLIKNGCIRDDSVQFYKSNSSSFRFSYKTFKFIGYPERIVVTHCDVAVCDVDDRESFCAKRCIAKKFRRKRGEKQNSGFIKECKFNRIHVSLRRSLLRRAVQKSFHLEDPACMASVNETHFFFTIVAGKCGTQTTHFGPFVEISNSITYRSQGKYLLSVPVKCSYRKEERTAFTARAFHLMHNERFVKVWLGQMYHFSQRIVLDSSVSELLTAMPLDIISTETNGVLDVKVEAIDANYDFVIDHCKIKPSATSMRRRTLVDNDCSIDESVLLHKTNTTTRLFIDFKKWKIPNTRIFAKCHFTVCHRNLPSAKCSLRGCQRRIHVLSKFGRKKRSASNNALKVGVECNPNKILVAIEKKTGPRLKAADLHLKQSECRAKENKTHIVLETKPNECQTSVKTFGTAVEYANIIRSKAKLISGIIERAASFSLPFKCVFVASPQRQYARRYKVKPSVEFTTISSGTYSVGLTQFTDQTYKTEMDTVSAKMSPGSKMYLQVSMDSPNATMAIYLKLCYGRPVIRDSNQQYDFIKDNCPVDDSVLFYKPDRVDQKRFSVSPFEFSGASYRSVYVDCIVSLCDLSKKVPKCFKECKNSLLHF